MHSSLKVALVTGASSGFGLLTARRLSAQGFRVFGTSRTGHSTLGPVEMLTLDVDKDASVRTCVAEVERRAGRLDVLINNAGRAMLGACEEVSADEAKALFETNVFGAMRMVSAVLPGMRARGEGVIVNIGSASGIVGVPFHGVYAASKHALAGYSEALRLELCSLGVRVSLIEPAAHRTGIQMQRPRAELALYDAGRTGVEHIIQKQIEEGDDPERVVDAIVEAATCRSPEPRYRVGFDAKQAAWGRRLLSARWFEWLVRRQFRLPA